MNRKPSPATWPSERYDGEAFVIPLLKSVLESELFRATHGLSRETLRDLASLCFDYEVGSDSDKIEIFETILEILRDEPLTAKSLVRLDGEQ
mgnify:CR=1 FL=1